MPSARIHSDRFIATEVGYSVALTTTLRLSRTRWAAFTSWPRTQQNLDTMRQKVEIHELRGLSLGHCCLATEPDAYRAPIVRPPVDVNGDGPIEPSKFLLQVFHGNLLNCAFGD